MSIVAYVVSNYEKSWHTRFLFCTAEMFKCHLFRKYDYSYDIIISLYVLGHARWTLCSLVQWPLRIIRGQMRWKGFLRLTLIYYIKNTGDGPNVFSLPRLIDSCAAWPTWVTRWSHVTVTWGENFVVSPQDQHASYVSMCLDERNTIMLDSSRFFFWLKCYSQIFLQKKLLTFF